jgi:hypothetical protein
LLNPNTTTPSLHATRFDRSFFNLQGVDDSSVPPNYPPISILHLSAVSTPPNDTVAPQLTPEESPS